MAKKTLGVLAFLFIMIGLLLTLENYKLIPNISNHWPALLLLIGIGFTLLFFNKQQDPGVIWIGSFFVQLSIFFYYLNMTSWLELTYLWPVFLGIVGTSFLATSIFTKKKVFGYLAVAFITLFLGLYLVFTISLKLWPLSLTVFGLSLLIIDHFYRRKR